MKNNAEKAHLCDVCGKKFPKPSQLQRHLRIHTGDKPFKCTQCGKSFNQKTTLEIHVQAMHDKIRPFICPICKLSFSHRGNLNAHQKVHAEAEESEKSFKCDECPCVFRRAATLNSHIYQAHTLPIIKSFGEGQSMKIALEEDDKRHVINVFTDDKRTECHYCQKQFKKPSDLVRHIRTHTKEKPFKCSECDKNFALKTTLSKHMKSHLKKELRLMQKQENKLFLCSQCGKPFVSNKLLEIHKKEHENVISPFLYVFEEDLFAEMEAAPPSDIKSGSNDKFESMLGHVKLSEMQNELEVINPGNAASFSIDQLRVADPVINSVATQAIISDHNYLATNITSGAEGGTEVPTYEIILKQEDYNIPKQSRKKKICNECSTCKRVFKKGSDLIRHMRIHTGEKPFKCPTCNKAFRVKSTCTTHMKIHHLQEKQTVRCETCNKLFATVSSMRLHQRLHTGVKPFTCQLCKKAFRTTGHLQSHLKSHQKSTKSSSNEGPIATLQNSSSIQCEQTSAQELNHSAPEQFLVSDQLQTQLGPNCIKLLGNLQLSAENLQNIQITTLDDGNAFQDFLQGFVFIQQPEDGQILSSFQPPDPTSIVISNPMNEFTLQIQDPFLPIPSENQLEFAPVSNVNQPQPNTKTEEKIIASKECPDCGKKFTKPSHMLRHRRIHTGEKPHVCKICNNTFTQKSSLDTHAMFTHSDLRPFQCPQCPFKTVQKGALKKHCSRAHPQLDWEVISGQLASKS